MTAGTYEVSCNILLPSSAEKVFFLNGRYYEILSPGATLLRKGRETILWCGLYLAKEASSGVRN